MTASPFLARRPAVRPSRRLLPSVALGVVLLATTGSGLAEDAGKQPAAKTADPAAALSTEREKSRTELEKLSRDITLSKEKVAELEASIADLAKDQATLRTQLVDAADKQKTLQRQLAEGEKTLADLHGREDEIHANLQSRRGVLAEVLGALERMGRNPPPALLVTPNDALSSVRSAILLGAVVPEMRAETTALARQLQDLAAVRQAMTAERTRMASTLMDVAEQSKRLELLLEQKKELQAESNSQLAGERKRSEELAGKAGNLQDLIASLESRIDSVHAAAEQARLAEEKRRAKTAQELERARELASQGLPDKNRIAPAYAFSDLKKKLDLPVAGEPVRWFGDDDGTGHPLQGMMVSTQPGALVTAPADGWVVYAGPFRSYGDLLILNVGDGYHLVLAGMDRMDVTQGQFVVAGEPVAEMGRTRLAGAAALALVSSQPTLYIEFRKDGKPVDPRPWWSDNLSGRVSNGT